MARRKRISPAGQKSNPLLAAGIVVGDLLFVSGQVALDDAGNVVGAGNFETQARRVMARIRAVVEMAGGTMGDVVKITTFLTSASDYAVFNTVRRETFPQDPPTSSTVIVAGLLRPELLVEVEAIAHLRDHKL
jgi:enamine deaminase RidA (YjgF/YER057c/UK114 family)